MRTQKELSDHIDYLIKLSDSIDLHKTTLLTGKNASGKSLIWKLIQSRLGRELKRKPKFVHASQQLRTASNPSLGAFSSFAHDLEWLATSDNTVHMLKNVLKHKNLDYLVLDEPEIGMGEELQLGLGDWLNEELEGREHGVLIICHSRLLVNLLKYDSFINIEGMSEHEWLNRTPIKYSIEDFKSDANDLFIAVRDRINENKDRMKHD